MATLSSKLRDLLLQTDLSETDVCVYLELFKKPAQTIWELVERTGLSKNAVYRAFESLEKMKMAEKNEDCVRALSLKNLVNTLESSERKLGKLANRIRRVAPFLRAPMEEIETFETLYTVTDISDAYMFMSSHNYGVNLEFGDFESFVPAIGGIETPFKFRLKRIKHASHHALCTTYGPYSNCFATKEAAIKFKNRVDVLNLDFKKQWIVFTDSSDYALFNDMSDPENFSSIFVKSKTIADIQRMNFRNFSQKIGNA